MKTDSVVNIGVPIYQGVDSLDVIGAFQVFYLLGDQFKPILITEDGEPITSLEGILLGAVEKYSFKKCPPLDVLFVPGAAGYTAGFPDSESESNANPGFISMLKKGDRNPFLDFLRVKGKEVTWVTGICTGVILLAAAGLLKNHRVTTHWAFKGVLAMFPELIVADGYPRYVIDNKVITGGGISSAIDCALAIGTVLSNVQTAKNVQLIMQYSPDPPYQEGDPSQADIPTMAAVTERLADVVADTRETVADFLNTEKRYNRKLIPLQALINLRNLNHLKRKKS